MIYFEFIKNRYYLYAISGLIFIATFAMLTTRGLNWGLDFVGGTEFQVRFEQPLTDEPIRKKLESEELKALGDVSVQEVKNPPSGNAKPGTTYSLRTKMPPEEMKGMDERLMRVLNTLGKCEKLSTNSIGPVVGESLRR